LGIATTSALTVRVHCCIGAGGVVAAGAVAPGGAILAGATGDTTVGGALGAMTVAGAATAGEDTVAPGAVFTGSVSDLGESIAGLAVTSVAGDAAFGAGLATGAVNSATGLSI
jgi:hypothetical protein